MNNEFEIFIQKVFARLKEVDIDFDRYEIDHLAWRSTSLDKYNEKRLEFMKIGEMIGEQIIRERPVSIFRLNNPIIYKDFVIPYFELFAPTADNKFADGWEHLEFVVDSLDKIINENPHLRFGLEGIDRKNNPEIYVEFEDCAAKFHLKNIEEALRLQKETGEL